MVALPPPEPRSVPTPPGASRQRRRTDWLVLATDGPASELRALAAGRTVRVTADRRQFRRLLDGDRPRIVIVCQPPAGDAELAAAVSERRRRPRLRAVHLAPPDAVEARIRALAYGFDDALPTTTSAQELAARLAWLDERAGGRPSPASLPVAERLELDLVAHTLRRGTEAVHLRPKEYGLLALLASHPGRAYTRRELLGRVWGPGHASGTRTVDVHVRWLRSKIEADPSRPVHLVTVRGVGYRLDPPDR